MASDDLLTSLLVRFHDAGNRFEEPQFEFDTFTRQTSLQGDDKALQHLEMLCSEALSCLPAHYLDNVGLLDTRYSDCDLWCLGAIQTDWLLGRGLVGIPLVQVDFEDPEQQSVAIAGLALDSPFEFEEDVQEFIPARFAAKNRPVRQMTATNVIGTFSASSNAILLLRYRAQLPDRIDYLIPSYENVVRLVSDLEDLISVAESLGRSSEVINSHDDPGVHLAFFGSGITARLGVHRSKPHKSAQDLRDFVPRTCGWSIRSRENIRKIPRLLADYYEAVGLEYPELSAKTPFNYANYPIVPESLLGDFRSLTNLLKTELKKLKCEDISPSVDVSVRDALLGLDNRRKAQRFPVPECQRFDVFLAHNSKDKRNVKRLANKLKELGFRVWYDEWSMIPGQPTSIQMEDGIRNSDSAAVLVANDGLGPWQNEEIYACLNEAVERGMPVMPVLLPGEYTAPELPIFLKTRNWVDLKGGLRKPGIDKLIAGIKGKRLED